MLSDKPQEYKYETTKCAQRKMTNRMDNIDTKNNPKANPKEFQMYDQHLKKGKFYQTTENIRYNPKIIKQKL